jgi:predicted HD superfamily hydrolase involved in NAD metabolism
MTQTITNPTLEEARARLRIEMAPDTLAHAERTAELARILATRHRSDPDRAELAGLIHDIADSFSDSDLLMLAEKYDIAFTLTEARVPRLLHGPVGAELLRREWGLIDEEILDAVRDHITGGPHMSQLSKIIFVADKIEPERDRYYGGLNSIRELAMRDLDEAVLQLFAWRMDQLVESGRQVDERLVAARNRLIERAQATRR